MAPLRQSYRFFRLPAQWSFSFILGLFFSGVAWGAALEANSRPTASPHILTWRDGTLTARVTALPLRQVMAELSRLSGAQVRWLGASSEDSVSVEFQALPLAEALRRMLPTKNFLLLYAATPHGPRLSQIWITSAGGNSGSPEVKNPPALATEVTPMVPEAHVSEEEMNAEAQPEEVYDAAKTLDRALEQVMNAADSSVRMETIELLESRAQEDSRVRTALVQLAHDNSDPEIQQAASEALERLQ